MWIKTQVFWDIITCRLANCYRRFGEAHFLHLRVMQFKKTGVMDLQNGGVGVGWGVEYAFSENLVAVCQSTHGNIPEDLNLQKSYLRN